MTRFSTIAGWLRVSSFVFSCRTVACCSCENKSAAHDQLRSTIVKIAVYIHCVTEQLACMGGIFVYPRKVVDLKVLKQDD